MAYAICPKCKIAIKWSACRGARLKNIQCPQCGGELKGVSYKEAKKCKKWIDLSMDFLKECGEF